MKNVSSECAEAVQDLKNGPDATEADAQQFVDTVVENKAGSVTAAMLKRKRTVVEDTTSSDLGGWYPWKEIADKEGTEALLEMVSCGSVITRRQPKLPVHYKVVWPMNEQVKYETQTWSANTSTRDSHTSSTDEDDGVFSARFDGLRAAFHTTPRSTTRIEPPPSDNTPTGTPTDTEQRDKIALASIRKAHSAWDRSRRDDACLVSKWGKKPKHARVQIREGNFRSNHRR